MSHTCIGSTFSAADTLSPCPVRAKVVLFHHRWQIPTWSRGLSLELKGSLWTFHGFYCRRTNVQVDVRVIRLDPEPFYSSRRLCYDRPIDQISKVNRACMHLAHYDNGSGAIGGSRGPYSMTYLPPNGA